MMTTYILDETNANLTADEKEMLLATDGREITPDPDCPEMTQEQFEYFSHLLAKKKVQSKTRIVSIRLSEETIANAKKLGSGYTGVLGRIVEYGLSHPEILSKCI